MNKIYLLMIGLLFSFYLKADVIIYSGIKGGMDVEAFKTRQQQASVNNGVDVAPINLKHNGSEQQETVVMPITAAVITEKNSQDSLEMIQMLLEAFSSWTETSYDNKTIVKILSQKSDKQCQIQLFYENTRLKATDPVWINNCQILNQNQTFYMNKDNSPLETFGLSIWDVQGTWQQYNRAGNLIVSANAMIQDGKVLFADVTHYYSEIKNQKLLHYVIVNNQYQGLREAWFGNNQPAFETWYQDGMPVGVAKAWYPNGHLASETKWNNRILPTDSQYFYHENGKPYLDVDWLRLDGSVELGKRNDGQLPIAWKEYDAQGKEIGQGETKLSFDQALRLANNLPYMCINILPVQCQASYQW